MRRARLLLVALALGALAPLPASALPLAECLARPVDVAVDTSGTQAADGCVAVAPFGEARGDAAGASAFGNASGAAAVSVAKHARGKFLAASWFGGAESEYAALGPWLVGCRVPLLPCFHEH